MVKYPLRVNTATFREWLSEFGKRVSKKLYKKLDYDKWRPMYLWCKPGTDWEEIEINVFDCPEMVYIVPRHTDKLSPNGVEIMLHENSFGDYLIGVMEDYNTTVKYSNASISALPSVLSAIADVTYDTYDYDTCTKLSMDGQCICNTLQDWQPYTIDLNTDSLRINGDSLEKYIEKTVNNNKKEEENNKMMKFDFGPVDSSVRMSMYGMAVKNANGNYVAYDAANKRIMDVDILNFEGANKFMYKMPVAVKDVAVGDIVVHMRKPMIVLNANEDNTFTVVDVYNGEEKIIIPTASPFGFAFMTKVINFIGNFSNVQATNNAPFGNMLPFILMNSGDKNNISPIALMAMMSNGQDFSANPFLMLALMDNKNGADLLPILMMMTMNNSSTHKCNCHCSQGKTE